MKRIILLAIALLSFSPPARANISKNGRLGVGMTNQLVNGIPALSIKLQRSNKFAFGALVATDSHSDDGGFGAGIKLYRNLFQEPYLVFYSSVLAAMVKEKENRQSYSGFQIDLTFGSEFHIENIESIGFSFEFGVTLDKVRDDMEFQTAGHHFITAGIHFYL